MRRSTKKPSAKPKASVFTSKTSLITSPSQSSLSSPTRQEELLIEETRSKAVIPITYIQCELRRVDNGLVDPDFVRRNFVKITSAAEPQPGNTHSLFGTLYDERLGASIYSKKCRTCDDPDCCGHVAFIELGDPEIITDPQELIPPLIDPGLGDKLKSLLNIVCSYCSRLMISEEDYARMKLDRFKLTHRIKLIEDYSKEKRKYEVFKCNIINADDDLTNPDAKPRKNPECNEQYDPVVYDKDANHIIAKGSNLDNVEIYKILRGISPHDLNRLGFISNHPSWIMKQIIIVLPPNMRQAAPKDSDESNRQHFDQSCRFILKEIAKARAEPLGASRTNTIEAINLRYLNMYSSAKGRPGQRQDAASKSRKTRRKGRGKNKDGGGGKGGAIEVKGIKEEVVGKNGLIRENLMGRRVDFSSRGVVTGDQDIDYWQIGIPEDVWKESYDRIYVMEHNIDYFQQLYKENKLIYYIPPDGYWRRELHLVKNYVKIKGDLPFKPGDSYAVQMRNGRIVLFNRNPSIHKVSTMSAVVVRTPYNTIRMSNAITTPLNMDYDGDEGNITSPQEPMAEAESRIIMSIPRNIINTENSSASMGGVLDAITAVYMMTAVREVGFHAVTDDELRTLRSIPKERDGFPTIDARLAYYNIDPKSTRGILSILFPPNFNYSSKGVDDTDLIIENGVIVSGTLAKQQAGPGRLPIAQSLYNRDDGRRRAMMFINDMMKLTNYYLSSIAGLSPGIEDVELDNVDAKKQVLANQKRIDHLISLVDVSTTDESSRKRREAEAVNILQSNGDAFGQKLTKETIRPDNVIRQMIRSKAKGDIFHLTHIVAQGGQQYELGNRLQTNITGGRGSVFDAPGVRSVESRGYIKHSLGEGFDARDQQSHHTASRVGLVDTSIKTGSAGEYHRLQNESLMDVVVSQGQELHDVNGIIIQYVAGVVGIDPFHTTPQSYEGAQFGFFLDIDAWINDVNSSFIDWD